MVNELKILIVCTGNTCRSPMAECYLKSQHPEWEVVSAGLSAIDGRKATAQACDVVAEHGLDLSGHRSRSLAELEPESFDRVLAMTESHLQALPTSAQLLSALRGDEQPVPDPFGGTVEDYRAAFEQIRYFLDGLDDSSRELISPKVDYGSRVLELEHLSEDPFETFKEWLADAVAGEIPEANGVCLSTLDETGCPDSRIVLIKMVEADGLVFFSNYASRKAQQLERTEQASMVVWWQALKRQVRFQGKVEKVEAEISDRYFASRDRESQLGAWASLQSQPIAERGVLEERLKEFDKTYPEQVPRPPSWGGYRLRPHRIEFWQGRTSRLHDRFVFEQSSEGAWSAQRLMP